MLCNAIFVKWNESVTGSTWGYWKAVPYIPQKPRRPCGFYRKSVSVHHVWLLLDIIATDSVNYREIVVSHSISSKCLSGCNAAVNVKTHLLTPGMVRHGRVMSHFFMTVGTVKTQKGQSQNWRTCASKSHVSQKGPSQGPSFQFRRQGSTLLKCWPRWPKANAN